MNYLSYVLQNARVAIACAAFALLSPVASLHAQQLRVQVPFAFEDGLQHLQAGTYTLLADGGHIVHLSGAEKSSTAMMMPDYQLSQAERSKLVFTRYGDRYFLREVWFAGSTRHLHMLESKAEKQLQIATGIPAAKAPEVALLVPSR